MGLNSRMGKAENQISGIEVRNCRNLQNDETQRIKNNESNI